MLEFEPRYELYVTNSLVNYPFSNLVFVSSIYGPADQRCNECDLARLFDDVVALVRCPLFPRLWPEPPEDELGLGLGDAAGAPGLATV